MRWRDSVDAEKFFQSHDLVLTGLQYFDLLTAVPTLCASGWVRRRRSAEA